MTTLSDFSEDEVTQLIDTPGAVLTGATLASGRPGMLLLLREAASGAKAIRGAQRDTNEFVRAVATRLREQGRQEQRALREAAANRPEEATAADDEEPTAAGLSDPAEAREQAVVATRAAVALLRERASQADTDAYTQWLLRIATRIVKNDKVKQGGTFSRRKNSEAGEAYVELIRSAATG